MPRQRQRDRGIADHRRIDDDVLSESALVSFLLLDARREDSPPVPVTVLVLAQMNHRTVGLEMAEKNPAVEEIPRIVRDGDRPGCEENGILVVSHLDGVDRHTGKESAAHLADIDFPLHAPLEHRRHHAAHALLTEAGVRDTDDAEDDDQQEPHQDDGARDHDAEPACHGKLERLTDCEAECQLAAKAVLLGGLVCRGTHARLLMNDDVGRVRNGSYRHGQ